MKLCDIRAIAEIAHRHGIMVGRRQYLHESLLSVAP